MRYTFYKGGQEYQTDNLSEFCREHGLRRQHIHEVVNGGRQSYKGWSLPPGVRKPKPTPINVDDEGMTVEQVLVAAEIAARSQHDPAYEKLVMGRIAKIRSGQPLQVYTSNEE